MSKILVVSVLALSGLGFLATQQSDPLTSAQLKAMADNMGLTTKVLDQDTGKFQIDAKTDSLNIPIAAEVSKSGNYIWFTVYLGDAAKIESKYGDLLKQNAAIQPDFFYVTEKGRLLLGVAVDNRAVSPAILKRVTDKLVEDVDKTQPYWKP
jgi:hypothetical protein